MVIARKIRSLIHYIRIFRNWPTAAFARYLKSATVTPVVLRLRDARRLSFRPACDQIPVGEIFISQSYSPATMVATDEAVNIWDVGGNIGAFVVWIAPWFPNARFVSFEPVPNTAALLEANRADNPNIKWKVCPYGLASSPGTSTLYIPERQYGQASAFTENGAPVTVSLQSAHAEWETAGRPKIHLMKIDCEGAEYDIIAGLAQDVLTHVEHLILETHEVQGHTPDEIVAVLESAGFTVYAELTDNPDILWATRDADTIPQKS